MVELKVIINNKTVIKINVNIDNDSVNDLISKVKKEKPNVVISLITIGGEDVNTNEYNKKLKEYDLDEGDNILISDYYNGGFLLKLNNYIIFFI